MRISDWSSDVCSSDLAPDSVRLLCRAAQGHACPAPGRPQARRRAGRCLPSGLLAAQPRAALGPPVQALDRGREAHRAVDAALGRSEQDTSEVPSLMRNPYDVFCLNQKITATTAP